MSEKRQLLSDDQMALAAEIWQRPMLTPVYKRAACVICNEQRAVKVETGLCYWCEEAREVQGECVKCGHMGTLNAKTRVCQWHREPKP